MYKGTVVIIMNKSYKINENITLHHIPIDKLKTTNLGVYIHRNLNKEDASMNALLPYVLKQGCKLCKNTQEIAKYLENLYGASLYAGVLKKGEDQLIGFDAEIISDKYASDNEELLEGLIKLLLSMIFEPVCEDGAFLDEYVKREKKNAIDRIKGVINDKRTYAQLKCMEIMCKDSPFGIYKLGSVEGIEKITPKALYEHYQKIISHSPIDIFICGEADIESITETIKNCLDISFKKADVPRTEILKKSGDIVNVTERLDVTQGKLCIGLRTNTKPTDDDFIALMAANSVFGSGVHSKLFNNVREKLSLCYYASSSLDKFKGLMIVNAGIEFENYKKAYDEIFVQLDEVKKGNISDFEFESAIRALVNGYRSVYDDPRSLASLCLGEIVSGGGYTPEDYIEKLEKLKKEDVIKVANKIEPDTVYFLTGKGDK